MRTNIPFLFCCVLLAGCATNFESKPLPANHPASVQAQEAPRSRMKRLTTTDQLSLTTRAQLEREESPQPDFQNSGMPQDMSAMKGMTPAPEVASSPAPVIYTCVMHPEVQQPAPGKCPKCGTTLVKKESGSP